MAAVRLNHLSTLFLYSLTSVEVVGHVTNDSGELVVLYFFLNSILIFTKMFVCVVYVLDLSYLLAGILEVGNL